MGDASSVRHFIQGLILVALFCFIIGIILQVFVLSKFHNPPLRKPDQITDLSNSAELARLTAIEASYKNLLSKSAETLGGEKFVNNQQQQASRDFVDGKNVDFTELYGSGGEKDVPPIVKAWRQAKLDWHSLLPKHNSIWERFGTPEKEGKLRMLVAKEVQTTDYLTRFHASGLSSRYGHEHGPFLAYSGCDTFVSTCMIHNEESCGRDQLCTWSANENICNDAVSSDGQRTCASPKRIGANRIESVDPSQCKLWVDQPAVLIAFDGESQAMFYHWWASWSSVHEFWTHTLNSRRDVHFFVGAISDPMFFQYFGFISDNCWRRPVIQVPPDTCFCNTFTMRASQSRSNPKGSAQNMMNFLQLSDMKPPPNRPKIGLISRRRKRFILNEFELVDAVKKIGFECELLSLESMTLYEQLRALRSVDVLIGVHGSALDNSVFLHPGSVLVQLLPYKLEHRITFQSSAESAGVKYMDWQLKDPSKTFLHWDLFEQANKEKLAAQGKDRILQQGQNGADIREINMFWINQDIIVPEEEWIDLVVRAVQQSKAAERGADINPLH